MKYIDCFIDVISIPFQLTVFKIVYIIKLNPLNDNPAKWSNTFNKFVGCCRRII